MQNCKGEVPAYNLHGLVRSFVTISLTESVLIKCSMIVLSIIKLKFKINVW